MARWIMAAVAALAAATPAMANVLAGLPDPGNSALLALGLTGLAVGWLGSRSHRRD